MDKEKSNLIEKLKKGPNVLFLGQKYLTLETGSDNFLLDVLKKFTLTEDKQQGYSQILQLPNVTESDQGNILSWMSNRSEKIGVPDWLKKVGGIAWGHVFSSAIDTVWIRSFRNDWREVHPIFEEKYYPLDIRNRIQLHCTSLFGLINRGEPCEQTPLNKKTWLKRKQTAINLARRMLEITTPLGVIVFEGYDPLSDWFNIDDIFPIIDTFIPGQVHFFSVSENIASNELFKSLQESGKIIPHDETFASFLLESEIAGLIDLDCLPSERSSEHLIQCAKEYITIPLDIWKQTSKSAIILDDDLLTPLTSISKDRHYWEFLEFLQDSSNIPVWSAYKRGFAFFRNYERKLENKTQKWLQNFGKHNEPIILHGQSGTGKTVALGHLAYLIRLSNNYPVLFIERKSSKPNYSDIDIFCKWVEDNGAPCTLVIWDGMQDAEQYYDLLTFLLSRGRKVAIVGSSYKINDETDRQNNNKKKKNNNFVLADSSISQDEFKRFLDHIESIDQDINIRNIFSDRNKDDSTFFVTLYRLLPNTRGKLRAQLDQEVVNHEKEILRKFVEDEFSMTGTILGYALWKANIIDIKTPLEKEIETIGGEDINRLGLLIGLIMVPGQFGINVPIGLLIRCLNTSWLENLEKNLQVDIFRWYEDNIGNIFVGPRHSLEAKLIVQSRVGGVSAEFEFIERLLHEIHDDNYQEGSEIQFAIDLLHALGPNGQDPIKYSPYFLELSKILTKIREQRGIASPRLMLQEASLIREAVSWLDKNNKTHLDSISFFNKAEEILKNALCLINDHNRNIRQKSVMLVELGTTLAAKNKMLIDNLDQQTSCKSIYFEAKDNLFQAIALFPDDFHPVDVFVWMSSDILRTDIINQDEKNDIKAELSYLLSIIDPNNLSPEQLARFYQKQEITGTLIDDTAMSERAIEAMEMIGSKAGYFIKAQKIVGKIPVEEITDHNLYRRICDAYKFLNDNRQKISDDGRCLNLLLRLWWLVKTKKPIFWGERQTVNFSIEDWAFVWQITQEIINIGGIYLPLNIRFLYGLSTFHLSQTETSLVIFRDLERDADCIQGKRRIIRSYLASTPEGKPRVFHGQVAWINNKGDRGEVYVEELKKNILFLPYDFYTGRTINKNDSLGEFHIAFNFIGALAEPKNMFNSIAQEKK